MIEKGNEIRILPNLQEKLREVGMDEGEARAFAARFSGTEQIAHDIWTDEDGQCYVTVDLCCEIPIECCEPV